MKCSQNSVNYGVQSSYSWIWMRILLLSTEYILFLNVALSIFIQASDKNERSKCSTLKSWLEIFERKKSRFLKGKLHMGFKYLFLSSSVCVGVWRGEARRGSFVKRVKNIQRTNSRHSQRMQEQLSIEFQLIVVAKMNQPIANNAKCIESAMT